MSEFVLEAKTRDELNKAAAKRYRREGLLPAIIYGQGTNRNILIDTTVFAKMATKASRATVVDINLDGTTVQALIKDYDKDYLKDEYLHVDFYELKKGKPVIVNIPLTFVGSPVGLKNFGVFEAKMKTLAVECVPENIVANFEVETSALDLNDSILVKDMLVDAKKYKVLADAEITVCTVASTDK